MPQCLICSIHLSGYDLLRGVCSFHEGQIAPSVDWADGNRAACDFFHRKILRDETIDISDICTDIPE